MNISFILMAIFVQQKNLEQKKQLCLFCVQNQCVNLRYIWGVCVVKGHFYALKSKYNFFSFPLERVYRRITWQQFTMSNIIESLVGTWVQKMGRSRNISFKMSMFRGHTYAYCQNEQPLERKKNCSLRLNTVYIYTVCVKSKSILSLQMKNGNSTLIFTSSRTV